MNSNGSRKFTNGMCRPVAYRAAYGERQLRAICAMRCGDITPPLRKNLSIPSLALHTLCMLVTCQDVPGPPSGFLAGRSKVIR